MIDINELFQTIENDEYAEIILLVKRAKLLAIITIT